MTKMKWLGSINLYFLICGLALLAVLFKKSDVISKNKIEVVEEHLHAKEMPNLDEVRGEVRSGFDIAELITVNDEKIEKGKALFQTNCISCHGKEGKGDGAALTPAPRNFTSLEGWTNGPAISSIYKTLQDGSPGTAMSSYSTLPVEDRMALAHYIRTLAANYPAINDKDVSIFKDTYELDQDKKSKSQVSVEVAISKLSEETKIAEMQIKEYEQILKKNQFNGYKQIASALVQSQDWKASAISLSDFLNKISSASSINNLLDKEKVESLFMDLNKFENKTIEPVSKSISE